MLRGGSGGPGQEAETEAAAVASGLEADPCGIAYKSCHLSWDAKLSPFEHSPAFLQS